MLSLFGQITLIMALCFAFLQSVLPLIGYARRNPYALAFARPSALGQCISLLAAYSLLTIAFALSDFSITYVAANSHESLPLMYRLTALWGAHEGSLLLWILLLNIWTVVYAITQKQDDSYSLTLSILGLISFCFLCFLILTSNPFISSTQIQLGHDLNPLLQDPGFVIHPPMLYMGYVGFSVAFAITQAALICGKLDTTWARVTRHFALAAWCFLTFGILLGSWWAYRVLGWGGFWFWDPVENASLLPWLSGTALIHVLVLAEKRNVAIGWAALLALISFALSLLGTFLVRSGVLVSVHTFANDPARGVFLLLLLGILITAALAVYLVRLPLMQTPRFKFLSRETGLLINSGLLIVAMLTILLGTLYPLILDALQLGAISVGAPYFNSVMLPLLFITMLVMGLVPLFNWENESIKIIFQQSIKKIIISLLSAVLLLQLITGQLQLTAIVAVSLSIWLVMSIAQSMRILPGMTLAHSGFAVVVIGIILSSTLNTERNVRIQPGNIVDVGPYQFLFISTEGLQGPNYRGIRADFEVIKNNRHIVNLYPEKRIYTVRDMVMTKVDIHPGLFRDLYIALGEPLDQNQWSVRIYYKPFVRWIWFGGIMMMIGGILAIRQKRFPILKSKPA